jgi:hypothetical protein
VISIFFCTGLNTQGIPVSVDRNNGCPFSRTPASDGRPDALCCSGDDDDLIGQSLLVAHRFSSR